MLLGTFFIAMWVIASTKPGNGGGNGGGDGGGDGGGTNNVQMVIGPGGGLQPLDSPGAVTNSQQQGLQGGIQPPQGGLIGDPAPVTDQLTGFTPITSTNTTRTLTGDDFRRGFVMTSIGTGEDFDFFAPPDAAVCEDWRAFGSSTDWMYIAMSNWVFQVGTNEVSRLRVYSFGKIDPLIRDADGVVATNNWFAPFMASLGIVPEANWNLLDESARPSQLWYCITPQNALVVTWRNALLDRDTERPISFQVEFRTDGRFSFRYDLSVSDDGRNWRTVISDGEFSNIVNNPLPQTVAFPRKVVGRSTVTPFERSSAIKSSTSLPAMHVIAWPFRLLAPFR